MSRFKKPLALLSLFLAAAFVIDIAYLNFLINRRIKEGLLKVPSSLFGRQVEISEGDNIHNRSLFTYLHRLGYAEREGDPGKGEFTRGEGRITIHVKDLRSEETDHRGFLATITYDQNTGDIEAIETGGVAIDTLILGIPEIARVADRMRQIRKFMPLQDFSKHLVDAVIAAEDRRFFRHIGIDYRAIARALIKDIATMSFKEGGSTITQQLARNFFLSPRKTVARKVQETLIALILEMKYRKEKILELYLNQIYLGQRGSEGIYGVGEASSYYFGKNARDLTLSESTMIAALVKSPNYYSPLRHPGRVLARMRYVTGGMVKMGTISPEEGDEASRALPPLTMVGREMSSSNYFTDAILDLLSDRIESSDIFYGDYHIYTTLDPVIQEVASSSLNSALSRIEKAYGMTGRLEGAVVIVDNATGEIVSLVGGRSYAQSQFNRATMAKRQVGSLFKPFVIFAALRNGVEGKPVTLSTVVDAKGIPIETREGTWFPRNFDDREYGRVTVRAILENSINTGAVRIGLETGLDAIINTSSTFGLGERLKPYPSMILGTFPFSPVEMAYAYATFASMGKKFPVRIVKSVYREGERILRFPSLPIGAVRPDEAFLILDALSGSVLRGTARSLGRIFPRGVAGKTGTTDDGRDSWFVAMTKEYTICTWVGFDDAAPTPLTGATGALPVSAEILKKIYRGKPPGEIQPPTSITRKEIDYRTGFLATSGCREVIEESFQAGTEPEGFCPDHPPGPVESMGTKFLETLRELFD